VTNRCPFCNNYAYALSVGDAYQMDCRYCEIQVEITKRAYAARCPDPVGVLDYIREKLKGSTRPRVDLADMKRTRQPLAPIQEEEMKISESKQAKTAQPESDVFTTAAKAIGTTLGRIAVKTGIAKPPAPAAKARKKTAPAKKPVKKPAKKTAASAGTKRTASKKSAPKKSTPKSKQAR